jgi:hypothetical protein
MMYGKLLYNALVKAKLRKLKMGNKFLSTA